MIKQIKDELGRESDDFQLTAPRLRKHVYDLLGEVERLGKQQERMLNIARGCTDYGGGYRSDKELFDAYQGGIYTVITALEASMKKNDLQLSALESIGKAGEQK